MPTVAGSSKALAGGKKSTKTTKRRRRAPNTSSYNTYIYRVLKQVHPEKGISRKAMAVMNSMVEDLFAQLSDEASAVVRKDKKKTVSALDVQTAVRVVLPGELAKHSVSEGTKAATKFLTK